MAQEKTPNEKPKRTRKPKAGSDALPVEQITELMLVHNKNDPKFGVQAVSEIDKDGKAKTVPADEKNENSFLKFDKNSSILENFIKNFWSQLKEPTHFRLLRMTYHDYKVNKQAIRDLSEGKQTDAVKEFLKRYEIRPRENKKEQSVNQKEKTAMADKETQPQEPLQQSEVQQAAQQQQQPQAQQAAQESQGPRYRYNENMVNWEELEKVGISKASLEQQGLLDSMLKGYKTNKLVPLTIHLSGLLTAKLDARLSLIPQQDGQVGLAIHGIRKEPQLERPYFGFNFNEEDKKNLRETGNMGRVAELNLRGSEYTPLSDFHRQEHQRAGCRPSGARLHPAGSERGQTYRRGNQAAEGGTACQSGGHDFQSWQGIRCHTPVQCRAQGTGIHLSEKPDFQRTFHRRRASLAHPDKNAQRRTYHPGGRHEVQEQE